ncbi:hypothetical protein AC249_AIPGENE6115 [Exaiptasia diaphana]|nr:hypothetical protein AC249_AIPGENE6115 [Exaiptasia diaphana]
MAEGWNAKEQEEIRKIAETAIESITRLSNIVERRNTNPSNSFTELQRRFPTTAPRNTSTSSTTSTSTRVLYPTSSRSSRSSRPTPYSRRTAGRPHESVTISKDVVVIEYGKEKFPSKAEKVELEKSRRIICGFEIGREWTSGQLERELSDLLKGCVYIRLLAELPSDDDHDDVFSHSVFDAKPSTTVTPTTAASTTPISNTSSPSISQTSTSATSTSATNTSSATVISASTNPISPSTVRSITATVWISQMKWQWTMMATLVTKDIQFNVHLTSTP